MKKTLAWILGILLSPILLFVVLTILLYIPAVQNWAVHKACDYASEQTGMQINIDRINLKFPLDLSVESMRAIQPRDSMPQVKDTIISVRQSVVHVQLMPLLDSQIEIDRLQLKGTTINTANLVHEARVKGTIGEVSMQSHGINLNTETVRLNKALLADAMLDVELSDTVPEDTTKSETMWRILVDDLNISRSGITIHMPGDTLQVAAYMGDVTVKDTNVDLGEKVYKVAAFDWKDGRITYDNNFEPRTQGIDANHIDLSDVRIGIDTLTFCQEPMAARLRIRECMMKEKSGVELSQLTASICMDTARVIVPDLYLATPSSNLSANAIVDMNVMDEQAPGKVFIDMDASVGKQDIALALADMPQAFINAWPSAPLSLFGHAEGNMQHVDFSGVNIILPTVFELRTNGSLSNLTNIDKLKGDVNSTLKTYDLSLVKTLLDRSTARMLRFPKMQADAKVHIDGNNYDVRLNGREGANGKIEAKARVNTKSLKYDVDAALKQFAVHDFVPQYGRFFIDADANANGLGLQSGKALAHAETHNDILDGTIDLDAFVSKGHIKATMGTDLVNADLYRLAVADTTLSVSLCGHVDLDSDLKKKHSIFATVGDITVRDTTNVFRPADMVVDAYTRPDTTFAHAFCGDFELLMHAQGGYEWLMQSSDRIIKAMTKQMEERRIDQSEIREVLPKLDLFVRSGKDNPIYNLCKRYDVDYSELYADMRTSREEGINGSMHLFGLSTAGYKIDSITTRFVSDAEKMSYSAHIQNVAPNDYVFNAFVDGKLLEHGTIMGLRFFDAKDELGLRLGAQADMEEDGVRIRLLPERPTIGYREFLLNQDNYILLGQDKKIQADVSLTADDGTGIKIYSTDDNAETWQDLTASIYNLDIGKVAASIPYAPRVTGMLNGDFHVTMEDLEHFSVAAVMDVNKMTYENCKIGNLGTEIVYMPKDDGSHYVDGIVELNGSEIANITGSYNFDNGEVDARIKAMHFPMSMANGFVPDQLIGLEGYAEGDVTIRGTSERPIVDGELMLDSAYLVSVPYGIKLKFDDDPVRIQQSRLLFENFNIYAYNRNPLTIMGSIDFSDLERTRLDMRMRAENYQIIDAKETRKSIVCGKAFVNFYGMMQGLINDITFRGKLDVLGATDMTYILRDSPITTDNQLDDLVKFTDFTDTTYVEVTRPPVTGVNMTMDLSINSGAHILAALNSSHSNYIDLTGGGDLRMGYNLRDGLTLNGRYTLMGGEMKYALPIIPLKTFTIQDGSYVEFYGDVMNPRLNVTATEETKAQVSGTGETGRMVSFICGVVITQTLQNMGLSFIIDAPEDMSIQGELEAMGQVQRGKIAVTMLTTGMYLAEGNTNGFTMNSALSSFLSSEINTLSGNALRSLDLDFGMDNTTDATGAMHTDYSFRFAKRFWNNRVKISIGGKLSEGSDVKGQNKSFFDEMTMEYRLDDTANNNLKVYYNNNKYDWLEGYMREYGAGYVWRRTANTFKDLFRWGSAPTIMRQPVTKPTETKHVNDSVK